MRSVRQRGAAWFRVRVGRPMNFAVVLELFSGTGRFSEAMSSHRAVLRCLGSSPNRWMSSDSTPCSPQHTRTQQHKATQRKTDSHL